MTEPLPSNVHASTHPCLQAKLSQLRAASTNARETKALVHEIALILGVEALAAGLATRKGQDKITPLGFNYTTTEISPSTISLIPILRSGLGMLDAIQTLLPNPVSVHHLGLFREPTTLEPVEYYNNLPYTRPTAGSPSNTPNTVASELAILLDPVIATGGTCFAAIQTLREWGGEAYHSAEWPEGTEIWVAGVDESVTDRGMIKPGLGDVGDRRFLKRCYLELVDISLEKALD
ncbi:hypothetical protein G7Y89_g117 [Cudoniella acicularis]|uniref:uracil phosphoribosyltransferase n=1 Tax=Cudoniella acicularis TaxID=354080 RepID=A0A8H4W8L9_9HELO|nr:hypothetical protein G7Y89_g117 [Cudoniella acicularis]